MKIAQGFLTSLGVMAVMLIAFYGLSHLIIQFSPSPISGWATTIVQKTTPAGWSNS